MTGENRSAVGKNRSEQNREPTNATHVWHQGWNGTQPSLVEGSHHSTNPVYVRKDNNVLLALSCWLS